MNNELPINPCPICGSTRLASTLALAHSTWASFWMVARVWRPWRGASNSQRFFPFQRFYKKTLTNFQISGQFQGNKYKNTSSKSHEEWSKVIHTILFKKGLTFLLKLLRTVRDFLQKSKRRPYFGSSGLFHHAKVCLAVLSSLLSLNLSSSSLFLCRGSPSPLPHVKTQKRLRDRPEYATKIPSWSKPVILIKFLPIWTTAAPNHSLWHTKTDTFFGS